jgi:CDP-diacylglycerol---glycerol-3-phosphate 3-phosphatidyltransferase
MVHGFLQLVAAVIFGGIYTAKSRSGRPHSERIDKLPDSPFVPKPLVELGYSALGGIGRGAAHLGITANLCTTLSLVFGLASAILIALGHLIFGGLVLLFGSSLDALDGIIARATGTASNAGEFFDATIDRANDATAFLGILWYYREDPVGFTLGCIALVGSLLVSYVRAKGEALGVDCSIGWMQRYERILWLVLGLVAGPLASRWLEPNVGNSPRCHVLLMILAVIGIFSLFTATQRSRVVYRTLTGRHVTRR